MTSRRRGSAGEVGQLRRSLIRHEGSNFKCEPISSEGVVQLLNSLHREPPLPPDQSRSLPAR